MAAIRRRKHGKDEDALTESLLDDYDGARPEEEEGEGEGPDHGHPPGHRHTALILHPGEFNLQAFIETVLAWWHRLFGQLFAYATNLWPQPRQEQQLSLLQAERLQQLRERVAEKFDIGSTPHQDSLRRLWNLAFSGEPCTVLKTPKWKEMGWQGEDPATDFRGAGLYGLDNLIYLAETHPDTFKRLLDKSEGARATWEYPFAVAGLNITWALSELLELHRPGSSSADTPPRTAAGRAFATLLSDSDVAFEELYCATYCLLDSTWLEMRASYMEFNTVMKRVKAEVEQALLTRPADLGVLRRKMLGAAAASSLG